MGDFFAFRRMLAPVLIHLLFWVGFLACLGLGVLMILDKMDVVWDHIGTAAHGSFQHLLQGTWNNMDKTTKLIVGLIVLIGGPLTFRLYCELLMLPFRINDTLTDMRNSLKAQTDRTLATAPAPRRV
jgi:hypothetical protein